ncbi:MAG: SagB/ThcOx family dehydrogenase [Candidatus Aureabacteria bacterium]|nr:SagB/ThcOx family dehydrogenase [Candidatus Auribacterota bacterium]
MKKTSSLIQLPEPVTDGTMSLEKAICQRRSIRHYSPSPLTLREVSQILWAAQGITGKRGFRAAPSAGAIYPVETYVAACRVEGLTPGLYKYHPEKHALSLHIKGDLSRELATACLGQPYLYQCSFNIILTGNYKKIKGRYGERGIRYTHIEIGHISENIYLQAESLGLGTVAIGAFIDEDVKSILELPEEEDPLYLMPIGRKP